jgi:hypothetical protein
MFVGKDILQFDDTCPSGKSLGGSYPCGIGMLVKEIVYSGISSVSGVPHTKKSGSFHITLGMRLGMHNIRSGYRL